MNVARSSTLLHVRVLAHARSSLDKLSESLPLNTPDVKRVGALAALQVCTISHPTLMLR